MVQPNASSHALAVEGAIVQRSCCLLCLHPGLRCPKHSTYSTHVIGRCLQCLALMSHLANELTLLLQLEKECPWASSQPAQAVQMLTKSQTAPLPSMSWMMSWAAS